MFQLNPFNSLYPQSDTPSDLEFKPITKISIKDRKSEKCLSSSKHSINYPSQVKAIRNPSLKVHSRYYTDQKSSSFSPPKNPILTRTYYFSKPKPVITSTLSSSYRRSSKVYFTSNDLTDLLKYKRQLNNKNIQITGKSCLKYSNS